MSMNFVPYVGKILCFLHICVLYSLYRYGFVKFFFSEFTLNEIFLSFEYKWFNQGYELHKRLMFIESNWPYFIGKLKSLKGLVIYSHFFNRIWLCSGITYANLWLLHHQRVLVFDVFPAVHHQRQRELSSTTNVRITSRALRSNNYKICQSTEISLFGSFRW